MDRGVHTGIHFLIQPFTKAFEKKGGPTFVLRRFTVLIMAVFALGIIASPARAQGLINITDINLVGLNFDPVTRLITATSGTVTGTVAGLPFTTGIQNFSIQLQQQPDQACSVLHLGLAPIDIDLLGLHVDTSDICLNLTALAGQGLLGDLLCGLAGGNLQQMPALLDALPAPLSESLAQPAQEIPGAEDICDGACIVLDLALGPLNLNLLGLNVLLDDCTTSGPVQVCISASEGEGLLGDLLCALSGGGTVLSQGNFTKLQNAITGINGVGNINIKPQRIEKVVRLIQRALEDGELSDKELEKIVKEIQKAGLT